MKKTFGETLKEIREARGLSQNRLSELSGVDRAYINLLESGKRKGRVSMDTTYALAKALEVSVDELYGGITIDIPDKPIKAIFQEFQQKFERMELVEIPLRGAVPAGVPFAVDQEAGEYVSIPREMLGTTPPDNAYALKISGESLIGDNIYSGDTAVVDSSSCDVIDGKIYIVRIGNECVARHVYKQNDHLRLKSSNGDYQDIRATEVEILGRVILTGRWNTH